LFTNLNVENAKLLESVEKAFLEREGEVSCLRESERAREREGERER
jgi:hypothetical protein